MKLLVFLLTYNSRTSNWSYVHISYLIEYKATLIWIFFLLPYDRKENLFTNDNNGFPYDWTTAIKLQHVRLIIWLYLRNGGNGVCFIHLLPLISNIFVFLQLEWHWEKIIRYITSRSVFNEWVAWEVGNIFDRASCKRF